MYLRFTVLVKASSLAKGSDKAYDACDSDWLRETSNIWRVGRNCMTSCTFVDRNISGHLQDVKHGANGPSSMLLDPKPVQRKSSARDKTTKFTCNCAQLSFNIRNNLGSNFHFHLEQPCGSDMLYQDTLQVIVDHTCRAQCDMCTAGRLCHPTTGKPLKKGTQIMTTSLIMADALQKLVCTRDHEHDAVAGSFRTSRGVSGKVSQYTELYTYTFASRLPRIICASLQCQEQSVFPLSEESILAEGVISEYEGKRRRLNGKSDPSRIFVPEEAINPNASDSVPSNARDPTGPAPADSSNAGDVTLKAILDHALQAAPRVGRMVIEGGSLFNMVQQYCPQYQIRVMELCKGADRLRKCPIKVEPHEAPYRLTLGIHRHDMI